MDKAFWLDNLLAACTALSAIVLVYGGWLALDQLREWLSGRRQEQDKL